MNRLVIILLAAVLAFGACKRSQTANASQKPEEAVATGKPSPPVAKSDTPVMYPARVDGKYGLIDKTGKMVVAPQFKKVLDFTEGLAAYNDLATDRWGFIDATGKPVIPAKYNLAFPFADGLAAVRIGAKFGCINRSGDLVVVAKFAGISQFSEDLAATLFEQDVQGTHIRAWGFIKTDGIFALAPRWDGVGPFGEGVAPVRVMTKKWGFMDKTGKMVIEPVYESANRFAEGLAAVEGSIPEHNKWGFIDHEGKYKIAPQFTLARTFYEGLAGVQVEEKKWGFIDKNSKLVIKAIYDDVGPFIGGLALAKVGDKESYIDTTGNTVWQEK